MSELYTAKSALDQELKAGLRKVLFPSDSLEQSGELLHTYVVLDGALIPDLLDRLYPGINPPEFACLYRGALEPDMAEVAPYLVQLKPEASITDWILEEGWGRHWGIFALTRADLKTVRKHFRTFLMVLNPERKRLYFRYYDPRVLPNFLPTCNAAQLGRVFGPIARFVCESAEVLEAGLHRFDGEKLIAELIDLQSGQTRPLSEAIAQANDEAGPESDEDAHPLLLGVRQRQVEALAAPRRAQLPRKIASFLREECPRQVQAMDEARLEAFVLEQIHRAARRGVDVEWDVCRFCWLAALHGPRFDEECNWACKVLEAVDQTGTERVDLLERHHQNYIEPMFNPA